MKIINARINSEAALSSTGSAQLAKTCTFLGIDPPVGVYDETQLLNILEYNKDKELVLFSNFPPNSSYPDSNSFKSNFRRSDAWIADSYSITQSLFIDISAKYNFKAVHVISSAPRNMLGIDFLQSLFPDALVTLKRNSEFISGKLGYSISYRAYMEGRIKESL